MGKEVLNTLIRDGLKLTPVVAVDMCDYSRFSETDEQSAIQAVDEMMSSAHAQAKIYNGRIFKTMGDGFLAEFPSAFNALNFATSFQKDMRDRSNLSPNSLDIKTRIGIHIGDVVHRGDGDILGHGVNIAARLQQLCDKDSILVSSQFMELLPASHNFMIRKWGKVTLKNLELPIIAYEVNHRASFYWRRLKRRFAPYMKWQIITPFVLTTLLFSGIYYTYHSASIDTVLRRNNLYTTPFGGTGGNIGDNTGSISAPYLRNVLENLKASDVPISRQTYDMLIKRRIDDAVDILDASLDQIEEESFASPQHIDLLHQIGALSYHSNPQKAVKTYEYILTIEPENKPAMNWLFRAYNLAGQYEKAFDYYKDIEASELFTPEDLIPIKLILGFTYIATGEGESAQENYKQSAKLLQSMAEEISALNDPRLTAHWQTELGHAYQFLGDYDQAKLYVRRALEELKYLGADTNVTRGLDILGSIALEEAKLYPEKRTENLDEAMVQFHKQYQAAKHIGKHVDVYNALYLMGLVEIERDNPDQAKIFFTRSLRLSQKHNNTRYQYLNQIGFAQVALLKEGQKRGCDELAKAARFYKENAAGALSPRAPDIIRQFKCSSNFFDLD